LFFFQSTGESSCIEPLQLRDTAPGYPVFTIAETRLKNELSLTERSYFDLFDEGSLSGWRQVSITETIRIKGPFVLLRQRQDYFIPTPLEHCRDIAIWTSQIQGQSGHGRLNLKRAGESLLSPSKRHASSSGQQAIVSPMSHTPQPIVDNESNNPSDIVSNTTQLYSRSNTPTTQRAVSSTSSSSGDTDGFLDMPVSDWLVGWSRINHLKSSDKTLTLERVFPTIFRIKYVRSTVSRYRAIQTQAEKTGDLWHQFVTSGKNGTFRALKSVLSGSISAEKILGESQIAVESTDESFPGKCNGAQFLLTGI